MSAQITPANLKNLSKDDLVTLLSQALSGADVAQAPAEDAEPTSKEQAEALIEESPFTHAKGRVYLNGAQVESAARVRSTGTPEIAKSTDGKQTVAVAIWRLDNGDVAVQNLRSA